MSKLVIQIVQMLIGLGLLIWAFYPTTPEAVKRDHILACDMKMRHESYSIDVNGAPTEHVDNRRIVAIGDVHGAYDGLLEVLHAAKVTRAADVCEWAEQGPEGVVVVQQGDLVDRGAQAWESLQCLRHLQKEASKYKSKVVRLIGNHEMWWINGYFGHRNPTADTRQRLIDTILAIDADVQDGSLQASYVHHRHGVPLLFIHAGIRPAYYNHLRTVLPAPDGSSTHNPTAEEIATYTNGILKSYMAQCKGYFPCAQSQDDFFEAGPDRGGAGIGGPLWTDFSILQDADQKNTAPPGFIQVVGHTMARCPSQGACADGFVRATPHLQAVCVDGGMYVGGRAYLEIGGDGHFRKFERFRGNPNDAGEYQETDLTEAVCTSASQ